MKLDTLIKKLSKAHNDYRLRFGKEPVIWDWADGALTLCAKVKWRAAEKIHYPAEPLKYYSIQPPWEHL